MRIYKENLPHLLFPPRCPFCDKVMFHSIFAPAERVCGGCEGKPEYVREPACKKCGKPLEDERQEYCLDCAARGRAFTQGKALWVYKGAVKDSLYRFKYYNRREYARFYGEELSRAYGGWILSRGIDGIVPIPLSAKRRRKRGFNQAELVARVVGRQLGIPVYAGILLRVRDTAAQKALNSRERKNNLKNAFKTRENTVQLNQVLLVDDIYTTGNTMNEAAETLRRAGVREVYCLSVSIGRGH